MNSKLNKQNIFLVGPMGAGKTSVGRHLAELAGLEFIDSDQEIEKQTGVSISWIFEIEGEAGFRKREQTVLKKLVQRNGIVLASGGGCILNEQNRVLLMENGTVIYLRVDLNTQFKRTQQKKGTRPLLDTEDPMKKLEELQQEREPLYRAVATRIYNTNQFTHAKAAAQEIYRDWLEDQGHT